MNSGLLKFSCPEKCNYLTAICPRQFFVGTHDGGPQVDDTVGHDDVVVDGHDHAEDDHGNSNTLCWNDSIYTITIVNGPL
jgi:hypothetical protein